VACCGYVRRVRSPAFVATTTFSLFPVLCLSFPSFPLASQSTPPLLPQINFIQNKKKKDINSMTTIVGHIDPAADWIRDDDFLADKKRVMLFFFPLFLSSFSDPTTPPLTYFLSASLSRSSLVVPRHSPPTRPPLIPRNTLIHALTLATSQYLFPPRPPFPFRSLSLLTTHRSHCPPLRLHPLPCHS
jgi:hypothetical protein